MVPVNTGERKDLHTAAILAAHFEECLGDLPKRTVPHCAHQGRKNIATGERYLLKVVEFPLRINSVFLLKRHEPI